MRHGDFVIKHNEQMTPSEAKAMQFVRDRTTIPVPKVHYVTETAIMMDFIDGHRLSDVWNSLPKEEKAEIKKQLRNYLFQLRAIEGDYIGLFDGEPAVDVRRVCVTGGPFNTEAEFNDFLLTNVSGSCPTAVREMAKTQLGSKHKVVLTHGDFVPQNILVKNGSVVGIIDWEFAGWYPEYWELIMVFRGSRWKIGYFRDALSIFPQRYDHEYIVDQFLGRISSH